MNYQVYKKIPNTLKEHRLALGLTQKEVADRLGFKDKTWISHWESGDALPNLISAMKLSKFYKTPIDKLFNALWIHLTI